MDNDVYCSMIHGGLEINLIDGEPHVRACCLRKDEIEIDIGRPFWQSQKFQILRDVNQSGRWDPGCFNCESIEKIGMPSFRTGMNQGLGIYGKTGITGPARINLTFDISCNLACRTCGPGLSTFWQKHLQGIGEWQQPIFTPRKKNDIIKTLQTLDLSNLRQIVFCGGETLMGQEYWDVARWLVQNTPDAKKNLTVCFQTNGTQTIHQKNYDIIDAAHLVKLQVSLDGVGQQFEFMRWPASWQQVTENLFDLRDSLPSNVMFLVEQTVSVFNVLYLQQIDQWVHRCFPVNREKDPVDCTRHLAWGIFALRNSSAELAEQIVQQGRGSMLHPDWKEDTQSIRKMLGEIKKFDRYRDQSFEKTFPELFECYRRFW